MRRDLRPASGIPGTHVQHGAQLGDRRGRARPAVRITVQTARDDRLLAGTGERDPAVEQQRRRTGHPRPLRLLLRGDHLPVDFGGRVRVLNAVAAAAGRTVSFVSFTVPQDQRANSYFAPLAGLATGPDTELNFGIVPYHPGDQAAGTTGDQARLIDAALAGSPGGTREWGI
ncbi:hypothetical protein, partial [Trebonia sp.]|uniref:hypothetical protein n=1 Tax=Trebonia sp. TaxID=2767075 RepID=UPI003BAEB257